MWLDDIIVVTWGDRKDHEKKLFDVLRKLENAVYRASEMKSEFFQNKMKCLIHEKDEQRDKTEQRKRKRNTGFETPGKHETTKIIPRSNTVPTKYENY